MPEALKNCFTREWIKSLALSAQKYYTEFNPERFLTHVFDSQWEDRELKQRMRHLTYCLAEAMPFTYSQQLDIILKLTPDHRGLAGMVFPDFVEIYGLDEPDLSIPALARITPFFSSEFAVRPFIHKYPERMLQQHEIWSQDTNHHIRRLASEGIRPRLPWAIAVPFLKKSPERILPILELLYRDESEYVRRSVANNLNDISKDFPELVLKTVQNWDMEEENTRRLVKHALRGLIKGGNPEALALFGFGKNLKVGRVALQVHQKELAIGDTLSWSYEIESLTDQDLRVELVIHFLTKTGQYSKRVFKTGEFLAGKEILKGQRNFSFQDRTIRKHYPGIQRLELQINGRIMASAEVRLY